LSERLDAVCQSGHFSGIPAIQACVFKDSQLVYKSASGSAGPDSVFDVASITKMAATTLCAAVLHSRGLLDLQDDLSDFFPALESSHAGIQVRHLLAHSSGLPAWQPFFQRALEVEGAFPGPMSADALLEARELTVEAVMQSSPEAAPGAQRVYSDTGFILLGLVLEQIGANNLHALSQELVFEPAGLGQTQFLPLAQPIPSLALVATGSTRPRSPAPGQEGLFQVPPQVHRLDPGEVDDDNAYALGGVAGHAGLFSRADELARLGSLLLEELNGASRFGAGESLTRFVQANQGPKGPLRALGFDLISPVGSSTGDAWGKGPLGGFGHLGFTGCALWIDRDRGLSAALLSNRVLQGREHVEAIRSLRPAFFDGVIRSFEEGSL
jgi:CubicO group peptidase (beta-lactamase class C family)